MDQLAQMRRLATVLGLRLRHAQTQLAQIQSQEAELRHALAQLDQAHASSELAQPIAAIDAIRQAEVTMRWQRWADARRQVIQTELAQVLAAKADARRRLARAAGKDAALSTVIAKLAADQRRLRL